MISASGLEVNPEKCRVILQMRSPSNVTEVQRLNGRIIALSRFIPQSGNRSLPFFKCLKKNTMFKWDDPCEEAFQGVKSLLSAPPVLSKPVTGTPLLLYYAVTKAAVGSVLVQEVEGKQKVIYFISHALQGPEKRYQWLEKAALAVLLTARKLRAYFQS